MPGSYDSTMVRILGLVALCGCGRIGFASESVGDAMTTSDGNANGITLVGSAPLVAWTASGAATQRVAAPFPAPDFWRATAFLTGRRCGPRPGPR